MLDLYLGSDLGLWALQKVPISQIGQVFTLNQQIVTQAQNLNLKVYSKNANFIDFIPSKNALSVHYPKILKPQVISKYKKIYNLHPAYLPWGKGYYPIFWALWENTPAGATLHEINEGIDQGNIVAQIQVDYHEYDTGGSLFKKVRQAEKELFLNYWGKINQGQYLPSFTQISEGTYHSKHEFFFLKTKTNLQEMTGKDLLKLIRCLTFEGYTGLEVTLGQQVYEVSLKLLQDSLGKSN